ncbi:MAG: phytanoyl-CoA dioxygenase family protein [Leptolyngbyaceae cyanobacterium RU_5_1]|nr:phytanoyl-CoA dioxygenase family protein [Leptolyngbyaceae cyanobacterium RU_5_1]
MTQNPGLFFMRKLSRLEVMRDIFYYFQAFLGSKSEAIQAQTSSIFQNVDVDKIVQSIRDDGYFPGIELPSDVVQEVLEYAHATPCFGDRKPEHQFLISEKETVEAELGKPFLCCSYVAEDCPAIVQLINDPVIQAIAAKFLGAPPKCIGKDLLWSYPTSTTWTQQLHMAQVFHYDLDDYRSIKFFFYLTDVDESSGAHVCIRGSHRNKKLIHQFMGQRCASIPDEKIVAAYGAENVVAVCGNAGFGLVEDPNCFHKGNPPATQERFLLQFQYAIHDYGDIRAFS